MGGKNKFDFNYFGEGGGGKNGPAHFFPTLENKEIAKYSIGLCYYLLLSTDPF